MVQSRNSNIELLRIVSMFVIVLSHVLGGQNLSGINEYLVIFLNSTIHAGVGVTCFMFISGYYGIRFSRARLNKTYSIIWVCSICYLMIQQMCGDVGLVEMMKSLFPISTDKNWYMSSYVFLLILSPWINNFIDRLERNDYRKLLLICIGLFYVLPTFFYFEITNDKGKGIVHMSICYMIGRYVAKYIDISSIKLQILWRCLLEVVVTVFVGNVAATLVRGQISWPFSRECTVTTLLIGVLLCMIALHGTSKSKIINRIAVYTFHSLLLNNAVIAFVHKYLATNNDSVNYIFENILITGVVCCVCIIIAIPLNVIASFVAKILSKLENVVLRTVDLIHKNIKKNNILF